MSGIVGLFNLDGAPIDRGLLHEMTHFMTFRGPDAQEMWADKSIGFGHALLRTTEESAREHQPFTLDGNIWIVADARVDAQADLINKLTARGEYVAREVTDVQRVPPAHHVTWSSRGLRMSRYWTLPIDEPIYLKRADDYTRGFKDLLDTAVTDRLRTTKIAIFMSGGLDSPTLAARSCKILR